MSSSDEIENWQARASKKFRQVQARIPEEWLLPTATFQAFKLPLETNPNNVLDVPRECGLLTSRELQITEDYSVSQLLAQLADGQLSSLETTIAFSKRAAIAQQLTSCLTEMFFEEAQERARFLDEYRIVHGRPLSPLHGLPISLKDGFKVVGHDATIGFVSFIGQAADENSCLVDMLLDLGAVLYVKTNIPQTLQVIESHNNISGRALNPRNTSLTPGGSSGGEGALVAFRGSPLGVGTDIGGSIRAPALCCGTYGFKPSSSRIPYGKQSTYSLAGNNFFLACAGPLANDLEALSIFQKAVLDHRPARYDQSCLDLPWRKVELPVSRKLRIGVLAEDATYPLHPPVRRVLQMAANCLRTENFDIISLSASEGRVSDAVELTHSMLQLNGDNVKKLINDSKEPLIPSLTSERMRLAKIGGFVTKDILNMEPFKRLLAFNSKRQELRDSWRRVWNEHNLDAVIAPGAQSTAVQHDTFGWPVYTVLQNCLNFPSCVIPYGTASKTMDADPMIIPPGQGGPDYIPEVVNDMPVAIQIFTPEMRDEECLLIAKRIEDVLRKSD